MKLPRSDAALDTCQRHLADTGTENTEVEAILVNYLLGAFYAEFEQCVQTAVIARAKAGVDADVDRFVEHAARRLVRHVKISDLTGVLGILSPACRDFFADRVNDTPVHAAWDNIVQHRMDFAHASGSAMTIGELRVSYERSREVLEVFSAALNVGRPVPPGGPGAGVCAGTTPGDCGFLGQSSWQAARPHGTH